MATRKKSIRGFLGLSTESLSKPDEYRIVHKKGETTFKLINQPTSRSCFYPNIFLSVVELSSRWISLIFLTCFMLSWFTFALLYYVASEANGDFGEHGVTEEHTPCIVGIEDFQAVFLFSMETQTTIGYGSRYVTQQCSLAILLVIIQSILGSLLLCILTGVVLFKFQEPRKRAHTVLFSKHLCVLEEDGKFFMEVQVLNMQRSQVIDPNVRAVCVMNREDCSGKLRLDMDFQAIENNAKLFFRPMTYRHRIDFGSPFWDFTRRDFEKGAYEVIVMLNGVDEFSDMFVQARTSYLPSETEWGRHFKAMTTTRRGKKYVLNYNDFRRTRKQLSMTDESASDVARRISVASSGFNVNVERLSDQSSVCDQDTVAVEMGAYVNMGCKDVAGEEDDA